MSRDSDSNYKTLINDDDQNHIKPRPLQRQQQNQQQQQQKQQTTTTAATTTTEKDTATEKIGTFS